MTDFNYFIHFGKGPKYYDYQQPRLICNCFVFFCTDILFEDFSTTKKYLKTESYFIFNIKIRLLRINK